MNVNTVSAMYGSASYCYSKNLLPKDITEKMLELGLDPNSAKNSKEALLMIQNAEQSSNQENNSGYSAPNLNRNFSLMDKAMQNELRKRIEKMADALGIAYNENTDTISLLGIIRKHIEKLINNATKNYDEGLYRSVCALAGEFNQIISSIENYKRPIDYMDLLAIYNKTSHNM